MQEILIPLDGSDNALRAVRHAITLARDGVAMRVHLLNVEEPIDAWEVKRFLTQDEIELAQYRRGEQVLDQARQLLDAEGMAYATHVEIGPVAPTIASCARRLGCDAIVMGTRGMGAIGNLLLGSTATKVIHLCDVAVTLVK